MVTRLWLIASLALVATLCFGPRPSAAQAYIAEHYQGEFPEEAGPAEKFSRGLVNSATGLPGEVVLNVFNGAIGDVQYDGLFGVAAGSVSGLIYGVMDGAVRMGAGLVDLFTFPVEINGSYEPLVEPEFPL